MDEHGGTETVHFADNPGLAVCSIDNGEVVGGSAPERNIGGGIALCHPVPTIFYFAQDQFFAEVIQHVSRIHIPKHLPFAEGQFKGGTFQTGDQDVKVIGIDTRVLYTPIHKVLGVFNHELVNGTGVCHHNGQ